MENSSEEENIILGSKSLIVELYEDETNDLEEVSISNIKWTQKIIDIVQFIVRRLLRSDIDYPLFIEMILTKLVQANGSRFGNILVRDGDILRCIALGEKHPGILKKKPKDIPIEGLFGYVVQKNKGIISNQVSSDPRIENKIRLRCPKLKTLLLIPLHNRWILCLANKKRYKISHIQRIIPLLRILEKILRRSEYSKKTILERTSDDKMVQNRFLAAMSHDLRTPLNGILGMVTLLPDTGPVTLKQKEYINTIRECTFQMKTQVNNFLDFNKMASESLVLKKEPLRVEESVKDALGIVRGNAVNKGLKINSIFPPKLPTFLGDRPRLTQILSNLLSNAVKFTDEGKVEVEVKLNQIVSKSSAPKWKVYFYIRDTGRGISVEDREKIFEFFKQSSNLNAFLSRSGTGFGLSFSRELVHLMDGDIWVDSEEGKGSTFTFYITLEEELRSSKKTAKHMKGKRIIVVDDRVEIRVHLSEILFKWGCTPIILASAKEALNYLSHDSKFDLGMIDICMPNMTGIELAQNLRLNYSHIPLIGISSNEISGGEEYFDYYTYKPVDQNQLYTIATKCIRNPKLKKKKSKRHLKILIAEDNNHNSYVLKELLVRLGYLEKNIKIVIDGRECVRAVKRERFDVVLMDIVMPVMSGIEASKEILLNVPKPPMIIAVSAAVTDSDKSECHNVGISGYLEKPLSKEKLETALLPLTSKKRS